MKEDLIVNPSVTVGKTIIISGCTVFFSVTEENWNKSYVRKRHHAPETRSVTLKGLVVEIRGDELKILLQGNNGFEKDGETYVFHKNNLFYNQNFTNLDSLGKWKQDPSTNP